MSTTKTKFLNHFRKISKIRFIEKLLRRFTQGKSSSHFISKFCANNYQYKQGTLRKFVHHGVTLEVDIYDYVGHFLYFGFEDNAHAILYSLVNESDNILDIGTNIGSTILQFANRTGEKGRIIGFEPDPHNFNECQKNIALNNFNNIEVLPIGLGHEKGEFQLVVDTPSNRGGNRIVMNDDNSPISTTVNVETVDNVIKDKNITQISLVKIDVEGFEMNVLKGAETLILRDAPIFFIEVNDNNLKQAGSSAEELVVFLNSKNYQVCIAETNQVIGSDYDYSNCHFDIIAKTSK